jgi:FtsP/CotA-like multicopper oxidase with cupredoxin domain
MNRTQRLVFLGIAAVIAVVAVFVLADSSEDDTSEGEQSAATATPTPTETPASQEQVEEETPTPTRTRTPEPTPEPPPLLTAARVTELEYKQGDTVRFRVRSSEPEEVHVHGYDLFTNVEPGQTARMEFEADITGVFEIEFEHSHTQIAELKVEPR